MSGQSKVEDSTVAAAPNASAPSTNRLPVVRRNPEPVIAVVMRVAPLNVVQDLYGVQQASTVAPPTSRGGRADVRTSWVAPTPRSPPSPHRGRDPRRGPDPARPW